MSSTGSSFDQPSFTAIRATPRAGPRGGVHELGWTTDGALYVAVERYDPRRADSQVSLHAAGGYATISLIEGERPPDLHAYGPSGWVTAFGGAAFGAPRGLAEWPSFTSIRAAPRAGPRGDTYELSWNAAHATSVDIEGYGVHGPSGSVLVVFDDGPPPTLRAYGPNGSATARGPRVQTFDQPIVELRLPFAPRTALGDPRSLRPAVPVPPKANRVLAGAHVPGADPDPGPVTARRHPLSPVIAWLAPVIPRGDRLAAALDEHQVLERPFTFPPPRDPDGYAFSETVRPSRLVRKHPARLVQRHDAEREGEWRPFPHNPFRRGRALTGATRPGHGDLAELPPNEEITEQGPDGVPGRETGDGHAASGTARTRHARDSGSRADARRRWRK